MSRKKIRVLKKNFISDLALQMNLKTRVLENAMKKYDILSHELTEEEAKFIVEEFGYEVQQTIADKVRLQSTTNMYKRPPIVSVMGHVDHGKTTLLYSIRNCDINSLNEDGNITQHVKSYTLKDRNITFLDTPGHESFSNIRSIGSEISDIVLLVISSRDGIQTQTIEAISHIQRNNKTIIVVITKTDLHGLNTKSIEKDLIVHNIVVESMGGDTMCVYCSAKTKEGIDTLLDAILLQSEVLQLSATLDGNAQGIVLEALLDKHRGVIIHSVVKSGVFKPGICCVIGDQIGKIRMLLDDNNKKINEGLPGTIIQILGFSKVPIPGEEIISVKNEVEGRNLIKETVRQEFSVNRREINFDKKEKIKVIIKADTQGSLIALSNSITSEDIEIIHSGVGSVNISDIDLAKISRAFILGFNVSSISKNSEVEIHTSRIIHDLIDKVKEKISPPVAISSENILGTANVIRIFNFDEIGIVAGCSVQSGIISKGDKYRILDKDKKIVYSGNISSMEKDREPLEQARVRVEFAIALGNKTKVEEGFQIIAYEEKI